MNYEEAKEIALNFAKLYKLNFDYVLEDDVSFRFCNKAYEKEIGSLYPVIVEKSTGDILAMIELIREYPISERGELKEYAYK